MLFLPQMVVILNTSSFPFFPALFLSTFFFFFTTYSFTLPRPLPVNWFSTLLIFLSSASSPSAFSPLFPLYMLHNYPSTQLPHYPLPCTACLSSFLFFILAFNFVCLRLSYSYLFYYSGQPKMRFWCSIVNLLILTLYEFLLWKGGLKGNSGGKKKMDSNTWSWSWIFSF